MSQGKDTEIKSEIKKLYEQIVNEVNQGKIEIPNDLKDAFLQLETLEEIERVELINTLSKKEGLTKEMCRYIELIKLKQAPLFEVVPEEILKHMYEFNNLNKDENTLSALALTSTAHYKLFQPNRLFTKFQQQVAFGGQDKVETLFTLLKKQKRDNEIQELLCKEGTFTDYSGRTFHCTVYEYAYWAKDTHMCRMLERHMDEDTKVVMLKRCETIEKDGLKYIQNELKHSTKHFDFTTLKTALEEYLKICTNRLYDIGYAKKRAWNNVGLAQRDVPAHVIHEYCRPDRTFRNPTFKENTLPRVFKFYDVHDKQYHSLYPLSIGSFSGDGLGKIFTLTRGKVIERTKTSAVSLGAGEDGYPAESTKNDLLAVSRLDEVRTEDLKRSLDNLKPKDLEQKSGCVIS